MEPAQRPCALDGDDDESGSHKCRDSDGRNGASWRFDGEDACSKPSLKHTHTPIQHADEYPAESMTELVACAWRHREASKISNERLNVRDSRKL